MGSMGTPELRRWPNPELPDSVFSMFNMKGRVTIITGGSGGIGSDVARALAEAGSDIAIWYMKSTKAEKLANSIARQYSVRCKAYQCDVSKHEQVKNTIEAVVRDFGRLDVMIANAGIPSKAGGLDDTLDAYHRVVDVDFHGAYYCAREAGKIFRKQKSGNIIFTASMSGHAVNVPQQQACYNACKAGVIHLCKSLAVELAEHNVRVNSVSPGYIDTEISGDCPAEIKNAWYELTPMKRDGDPRELKGIFLYLASDASTYTTGADFVVDGGYVCR